MKQKSIDVLRMFALPAGTGQRNTYRESLVRSYAPRVWSRKITELIRKGYVVDDGRGGVISPKGMAALRGDVVADSFTVNAE